MASADIAMDGVYAENAGAVFCLLTDHRGRFQQRRSMVEQLIATCFRGPRRLAPVGSIPVRRGTFSQQPALVYRQSSISRHVSQISPDKNMHFRSTKLPRPRQLLLRCPTTVHPWTYAHAPYLHPCRQSAACPILAGCKSLIAGHAVLCPTYRIAFSGPVKLLYSFFDRIFRIFQD